MESEKITENVEKISLYSKAKELREKFEKTDDLVLAVGKFILDHMSSFSQNYEAQHILESRFTPPEEALEKGMDSCGAITNIAAEMLRSVGLQIRFVHGESDVSVDHAWISVFTPETDSWIEYDLTKKDGRVPTSNIKKNEVDSWEDIRDQIETDHETFNERMRKRRVQKGE